GFSSTTSGTLAFSSNVTAASMLWNGMRTGSSISESTPSDSVNGNDTLALDQTGSAPGTSSSVAPSSVTPPSANELLIGWMPAGVEVTWRQSGSWLFA